MILVPDRLEKMSSVKVFFKSPQFWMLNKQLNKSFIASIFVWAILLNVSKLTGKTAFLIPDVNAYSSISCGDLIVGNTFNNANNFGSMDQFISCPVAQNWHYPAGDSLFRFDLEEAANISIKLLSLDPGTNLDLFLWSSFTDPLTRELKPTACMQNSINQESNTDEIFLTLDAGTYFIIVDGGEALGFSPKGNAGNRAAPEGPFELSLTCIELPRPCELEGQLIANGTFINQDALKPLPELIRNGLPCLEEKYENSQTLFADAYHHYIPEAGELIIDFLPNSNELELFVFDCGADLERSKSCLGSIEKGELILGKRSSGFYTFLVVGTDNRKKNYEISVQPLENCSKVDTLPFGTGRNKNMARVLNGSLRDKGITIIEKFMINYPALQREKQALMEKINYLS